MHSVNWFTVTATKDYHEPAGLKQKRLILLWFWRLQVQNWGVSRATLPLEALGEKASLPLPVSGGSRCPWACGHIAPDSASIFTRLSPSLCVFSTSVSYKDTYFLFRTHLVNQMISSSESSFIFICRDAFFFFSQIRSLRSVMGVKMWIYLWGVPFHLLHLV